ncbi:MAG: VanW family protein [Eubacteriales bacterium]
MAERIKESINSPKKRSSKTLLVIFICLVVAALAVTTFLIVNNIIKNAPDRAVKGVTISGVDISGMTLADARTATANVPTDLLANAAVSVSFNGTISKFTSQDLDLTTDYDAVIEQAFAYGHTDTQASAATDGSNFTVHIQADKTKINSLLSPIAKKYDKQPVDASVQFMPWGYLTDGTAYQPDQKAILEACADGVAYAEPSQLVRLTADQMPNKLRYEYWQNTKYIANYIPADANIARFQYKDSVNGQTIDVNALTSTVVTQLESGDMSTITAPITAIEPKVKLTDLKKDTQLVASWTSSFSNHWGHNRNYNVAKLSGIINSVVIQPGQTWSINKQAGNRTVANGWLEAPGIELGGYTQQPGGGVCQISSTLYNASIRANLDIVDSSHHTISSNYIPLGLDATISSGSPDLQIKNPYDSPIYIVSYVNPKDKNVTVEIYGQPVNDPKYGDVILDYSSVAGSMFGTPGMAMVYNTAVAPDNTPIAPGQAYVYALARQGQSVQTYKYFISLDGKQLGAEKFTNYAWNPINGTTYVNGPPPPVAPTPVPAAATPAAPTTPAATSTDTGDIPPAPILH